MIRKGKKVSIIIPAYNEEDNISNTLDLLLSLFKNQTIEIIVVDDGSTDNTPKILENFSKKYLFIHSYRHQSNMGYAEALKTGFRYCEGEFIMIIDADLQNDPRDILHFLDYEKEYDVLVGWRKNRKDSLHRLIISGLYNAFLRVAFNLHLVDINGKPKLFKSKILKNIKIESKEWAIDLELIHKSKCLGYKILQVPVRHLSRKKGVSKVNLRRGIVTCINLLKYRIKSFL